MNIRPARSLDESAIRALLARFPETVMQEHLPRPEEFFVAEENGIIACCALEVYSKRIAEIRSLAVLPEYRGRGIATQLVEACMDAARTQGIYELLAITSAVEFFEKRGFGTFNNEKYALIRVLG